MLARYMQCLCYVSVCLCICTSQVGVPFLSWRFFSTYRTLYCKEIWVTPKIRVLPSGTLSKILDLQNFVTTAAVTSECCQQINNDDDRQLFVAPRPYTARTRSKHAQGLHLACQLQALRRAVRLRQLIIICSRVCYITVRVSVFVREQRVTGFSVFTLIGLSTLVTPLLRVSQPLLSRCISLR